MNKDVLIEIFIKRLFRKPCQKDTCEVSELRKVANGQVFQGSEDRDRQNIVKDLKRDRSQTINGW